MKTLIAFFTAVLPLTFIISCKGKTADAADAGSAAVTTTRTSEVITSIHYFKGGWYGLAPNWKYDMTIDFMSYVNGEYKVTAKTFDSLCFKIGSLSVTRAQEMIQIYSGMLLLTVPDGAPITVDAGEDSIEIKTQSGAVYKFYFSNIGLHPGQQYVTNPQAMQDFLKNLEASLATACQ